MTIKSGFTVVELMVVVAIIAILAAFSFSAFVIYGNYLQLQSASAEALAIIKETRQRTLASETSEQFGIAVASSSFIVFEGNYVSSKPTKRTYRFPGVNIQLQLTSATTTIVFARLTGVPNATGTILLVHERTGATTSLTVAESGLAW